MSDKVFSIPETVRATPKLQEDAVQILERYEAEREDLSATSLVLDNSNRVSFPGYRYIFEALGEKIIVSIDVFKSGYECKVCGGRKKLEARCHCEEEGKAGLRYSPAEIGAIRTTLGDGIADARTEQKCPECKGDYPAARTSVTCAACKGMGATLILPETSKNLPTTGVVVSMGNACNPAARVDMGKEPLGYGIGDRILFGPYAGNMIPTKAGILFKILDADNAWCKIEGAEGMGQFDFILQDNEAQ